MKDSLDPRERFTNRDRITNVSFDEVDSIGDFLEVRTLPGVQVIKNTDFVPCFQKTSHDMGANESGSSGY
jgi:hypothetical protein